jgi:hypothetical protein
MCVCVCVCVCGCGRERAREEEEGVGAVVDSLSEHVCIVRTQHIVKVLGQRLETNLRLGRVGAPAHALGEASRKHQVPEVNG